MVNFVMDTEFVGAIRRTPALAIADLKTHIATIDNTHTIFDARIIDVFRGQKWQAYVVSGV